MTRSGRVATTDGLVALGGDLLKLQWNGEVSVAAAKSAGDKWLGVVWLPDHPSVARYEPSLELFFESLSNAAIEGHVLEWLQSSQLPAYGDLVRLGLGEACAVLLDETRHDFSGFGAPVEKVEPSYLDSLLSLSYRPEEGRYLDGVTLIAQRYVADAEVVKLVRPVALRNTKWARKILDIGIDLGDVLIGPIGDQVYLLGVAHKAELGRHEVHRIRFEGRGCWSVLRGDQVILRVVDSQPVFRDTIRSQFALLQSRRVSTRLIGELAELVLKIVNDARGHGAILIVTSRAAAEASRLAARSTAVEPLRYKQLCKVIAQLSRVDGAVILDRSLTCHAFGAILDGSYVEGDGDSSRGSRYNSVVAYLRSAKDSSAFGLVFSTDGGMTVVPPRKGGY